MPLASVAILKLGKQPRERAGLTEPACHRRFAFQKISNFNAGKPGENPAPFIENRPDGAAVANHPSLQVLASGSQQPAIATQPGCYATIICGIDPINAGV